MLNSNKRLLLNYNCHHIFFLHCYNFLFSPFTVYFRRRLGSFYLSDLGNGFDTTGNTRVAGSSTGTYNGFCTPGTFGAGFGAMGLGTGAVGTGFGAMGLGTGAVGTGFGALEFTHIPLLLQVLHNP